jgi:hypothetical protein
MIRSAPATKRGSATQNWFSSGSAKSTRETIHHMNGAVAYTDPARAAPRERKAEISRMRPTPKEREPVIRANPTGIHPGNGSWKR